MKHSKETLLDVIRSDDPPQDAVLRVVGMVAENLEDLDARITCGLEHATGRRTDLSESVGSLTSGLSSIGEAIGALSGLVGERGRELSALKADIGTRIANVQHDRVSAVNTVETRLTDLITALSNQFDGLSETLDRAAQKAGTMSMRLDKRIDDLDHDQTLRIAEVERKLMEMDSRIDRL